MRHNGQARQFPKIGMRNIKTAIAAALCAFVYYFFDRSPAFACIGAIFGMGSDLEMSKLHGGNRLFGTVIGGLLGMALFRIYLIFYPEGGRSLLQVVLVFIGTILLILLCQLFWVGGVQPGGVVLCILLFNTPVDTYISYALSRIFDTGVGVVAALGGQQPVSRRVHFPAGGRVLRQSGKEAGALQRLSRGWSGKRKAPSGRWRAICRINKNGRHSRACRFFMGMGHEPIGGEG